MAQAFETLEQASPKLADDDINFLKELQGLRDPLLEETFGLAYIEEPMREETKPSSLGLVRNLYNKIKRNPKRIGYAVLALVSLSVTAESCEPAASGYTCSTDPNVTPNGYNVAIIGDSLTVHTENDSTQSAEPTLTPKVLSNALRAKGYCVDLVARVGAQINNTVNYTSGRFNGWTSAPDIAVTWMGTNDVRVKNGSTTPETPINQAEADYEQYLQNTGARRDVMVTLSEKPSVDFNMDKFAPEFNQFIQDTAAANNGYVARWDLWVKAFPNLVSADGVHPTDSAHGNGRAVAKFIITTGVDDMKAELDSETPTTTEPSTTTTSTPEG